MKIKSTSSFFVLFCLFALCFFANLSPVKAEESAGGYDYGEDLVYGLEAYKHKDWSNALFFLRKAASVPTTSSEEIWLLMILAEINVADYHAVMRDAEIFVRRFQSSPYIPHVEYQVQLARFGLELYQESAEGFCSFLSHYPEHPLIPSALFWRAECLFRLYEYAQAHPLYKRVVDEYPESPKYAESVYRIELIRQREREEKLLYLLRVTGEEVASAREEYERQVKFLQGEEAVTAKRNVQKLEEQILALQTAYEESQKQNTALNTRIEELISANEQLSAKAVQSSVQTEPQAGPLSSGSGEKADLLGELKRKTKELEKLLGFQGEL